MVARSVKNPLQRIRNLKMLESRSVDALVKLVKTVEIVETVETVDTIETVETGINHYSNRDVV